MAKETDQTLWIGTDFQFVFHIKNEAETAAVDITGWTLSWKVKRSVSHADSETVLSKTATVSGTFNSDPAVNTQRATVTIDDTDTDGLTAKTYRYELKRTDAGQETVLAYGALELKQPVHRT